MVLLLGGTPAHAHTALKEAAPGPGAKVAPGADVVALTFGRLEPDTAPRITLTGPDGAAVPVGRAVVVDDSVTCAAVAPLRTGVSTLTYTVTSADGDTLSSAFQFEVAVGAEAVATPSACEGLSLPAPKAGAATAEDGRILGLGRTTALAVLTAAVVVIVGAGVLAVRTLRGARTAGRRKNTV
ncbi:copper resistance protein CopC [Streptomyces sp. NPDC057424]|uniref:copper resistance CopC family protein n=1 Tax=Streptomyces sp. NPDC057424 TaxID=3346127 RepID=UPI0036915898